LTIPRYRQLTDTLKSAIASGEYPIGALLPTEVEICKQFGVSRHTVRDALRLLSAAGLIQRRRRVGTVVTAQAETPQFFQSLPSIDEVLQAGHDVRLIPASHDTTFLCPLAEHLDLGVEDWLRIDGQRGPESHLIGVTTVLIRRDCAPSRADLEETVTSLADLTAFSPDIVVARVDQDISAVTVDRKTAQVLKATAGSPALRARRLYFDQDGKLFLASESLHPAGRFNYRMSFTRAPTAT
jgi:DNA-binding GntR family transcriptional regulator